MSFVLVKLLGYVRMIYEQIEMQNRHTLKKNTEKNKHERQRAPAMWHKEGPSHSISD